LLARGWCSSARTTSSTMSSACIESELNATTVRRRYPARTPGFGAIAPAGRRFGAHVSGGVRRAAACASITASSRHGHCKAPGPRQRTVDGPIDIYSSSCAWECAVVGTHSQRARRARPSFDVSYGGNASVTRGAPMTRLAARRVCGALVNPASLAARCQRPPSCGQGAPQGAAKEGLG